jgi:hypothetical protein
MFLTTVFVVVLFILTQFSGPIVYNLALAAYQVLLVRLFGAPAQWLAAHTGFNTYDAFFWAKLVYTLLIAAAMVAALWFYSRNKQEFLLSLWLIGGALGAVVLANIASKVLKSYWLQTFSRDMLEVLTSPFPVLFLIPVLILYRSTAQGPK